MPHQAYVKSMGHTLAHRFAAAVWLGGPWWRRMGRGLLIADRQRWPVMRTLLAIVGLVGFLLATTPNLNAGGASQAAQVGVASWYGKQHEGRKTASGQRFSRKNLTAAHRSLPLGTKVKVTNLRTKKQVVVTITDRGPYGGGKHRIIDLSEAAAARLGLLERGTERVQVVVVENAS